MRLKLLCLAALVAVQCAAADVKIDKLVPFATDHDVRVQARVASDAGPVELTGRIVPAAGGAALWEGSLGTSNDGGAVEKTIGDLKPQLWSPGSPTLYNLVVTAKGKSTATETVRFGFRSVASAGGHILLNGHPIFLCGIAINPPERDIPDSVGYGKTFVHDYVAYLRSQHVNLIRMTFAMTDDPRQQVWFDACDELGMLVDQGNYASPPSGGAGRLAIGKAVDPEENPDEFAKKGKVADANAKKSTPQDFNASIAAYTKVFETYARHPSIIIYILANELPGPVGSNPAWHEYLTKAYDRLHAWDPSRLFIGNAGYGLGREGDINDVHRYWGWYYNSFLTYYNLRDTVLLYGPSTDNQPFTFSECVGTFTGPMGAINVIYKKQLGAQLCWTGHSSDQNADAMAYQSFIVKHALESFRTMREQNHRISGLMPFTILFHNWEGITSFADMKPKPAMKQMGVSYQPVLLSWEMWTPQVYAGTQVKAVVHIVNDAEDFSDLDGAKLNIELFPHGGGLSTLSKNIDLPAIKYFEAKPFPIAIDLPANIKEDDYVLTGTVTRNGESITTNQTPLFVANHSPVPQASSVAIFDPAGATLKALQAAHIDARPISDLSQLGGVKHLIIGEMALDKPAAGAPLKAFIEQGGRVLCLAQNADNFDPSWLPTKIEMLKGAVTDPSYPTKNRPTADQQNLNPERPWHPALAGIDRHRLELWSDYTGWDQSKPGFPRVLPVAHGFKLLDEKDLSHTAVIIDYDRGLEGVALAECFAGKGSVLMTGLDLIPRAGRDPIADRMLINLVNCLVGEDHETQPLIDKPIIWGDYATERGVITGPLNGLIYNCRWVAPPTAPNAKPMPDNAGAWNTHPGNPFVPQGVRVIGPFGWSTGSAPRENAKIATGTGVFHCRVPAGRRAAVTQIQNPGKSDQSMSASINGGKETSITVPAGKTLALQTALPQNTTDLSIQYAGSKEIVILQTEFK